MRWLKPDLRSTFASDENLETILSESTAFKGELTSGGSVRIDGRFEGTIQVKGILVVGPSAVIQARIAARSITVAGAVSGDLTAEDAVSLLSNARVCGKIVARTISVEQGAVLRSEVAATGDESSTQCSRIEQKLEDVSPSV